MEICLPSTRIRLKRANARLSHTSLHYSNNRVDFHFIRLHCDHSSTQKRQILRGGGTPYNGLYVEAPPERGTFFRQRVVILLVNVYERLINLFAYLFIYFSDI